MKLRALLDTNIIVAGLSSQLGASYRLLELALNKRFVLLASPALWLEYESVLKRPEIVELHGFRAKQIDEILNGLADSVEPVSSYFLWRPQLRDPKDEMVLEAAVNGSADYLVTLNSRDFLPAIAKFGIQLALPGQFLTLLEKSP